METIYYVIAFFGFAVVAAVGMFIDNYQDRRHTAVCHGRCESKISSKVTTVLMIFYAIAVIVLVCIQDRA